MIRYSYAGRHNPRYMPYHQNVFVWRSVGSGGAAPIQTAAPKVWALRGGFGRHATTGGRGYSK